MNDAYPTFKLFIPKQAVGASLVYFDLFNATGSGVNVLVNSVIPIVSGAVAVTGVVGVDLYLERTSAIGTAGTAATYNGTDIAVPTFSGMVPGDNPSGSITARITPTGGATVGAIISWASLFTEETNAATYMGNLNEMVTKGISGAPGLLVVPNTGIRVAQGTVASVGNIGFDISFQIIKR